MATEIIEKVLYDGDVVIHFYPNSHQYKLAKKDGKELQKKINIPSVTSITGQVDKSRVLIPWSLRVMKERGIELLGEREDAQYTYDEIVTLLEVAEQAPNEKKQRAAGIGDYVHKFAEEYSKDKNAEKAYERMVNELGEPNENDLPKINAGTLGLVGWFEKNNVEILEAEQLIYSKKFDYTGTFDAVIKLNGKTYLVDYKTSNGIYDEHYYQTSAYLKAKEEETGEKYDGVAIIAICKEDKENKDGIVVKSAGDITVELRSRSDLIKDFIAFKGLIPLKNRSKELAAEWRKNNK